MPPSTAISGISWGWLASFALPVTQHGTHRAHRKDDPLPTITGANRGELELALPATELVDEVVIDINYRMLHWRELARAGAGP
ncbi:hypothetical protein ABE473_08555 [Stenotrophomonas sp. TWI700]|uniref:hypothetical protein n=1 Tax=Stenotrophomonas sp. TWI700 TaxID=3136792 RepID=UPI00320923DB